MGDYNRKEKDQTPENEKPEYRESKGEGRSKPGDGSMEDIRNRQTDMIRDKEYEKIPGENRKKQSRNFQHQEEFNQKDSEKDKKSRE